MDPSWKVRNVASFSVVLSVLIFASLFKGTLSRNSKYQVMVPDSVSVQQGLCAHIPCSFTSEDPGPEQLEAYWFQKIDGFWYYYVTRYAYLTIRGVLVAVNHEFGVYKDFVKDRFQITGDVMKGDCSLSILDVRLRDAGEYYFRIQNSKVKHSYETSILRVLVTELTEKPHIWNSSAVPPGKKAIFTCSALGPCTAIALKVSWTTVLLNYTTSQWKRQHSNRSWTYGSDFIFTPSTSDAGKWLTCQVWYPNINKQMQNTVIIDIDGSPEVDESVKDATKLPVHERRIQNMFPVPLFLIFIYLAKMMVCILFVFSAFCLFSWRKNPMRRAQ